MAEEKKKRQCSSKQFKAWGPAKIWWKFTSKLKENQLKLKISFSYTIGSRIWRSSQYITPWLLIIKLQHLETNLHRLSSTVNFLIFVKSNSKLVFPVELLSRSVRTLMINISSSKLPANTMDIHSVRNVCKLSSLMTRSSSQRRSTV